MALKIYDGSQWVSINTGTSGTGGTSIYLIKK
jgi:hypothetical protein